MLRLICTILFLSFSGINSFGQYKTTMHKMYARHVKDSFEIYISKPVDYSAIKSYDVIYYCDANLKSGKELRKQITPGDKSGKRRNLIFVGIGHIGNYHVLRRRDFILPFISKTDTLPQSANYGHIKDFYNFLTNELIPFMDASYPCSNKRTIIGHSLGGLFVIYSLFQNDKVFTNFVALSPALWIDYYSIYNFNKISISMTQKSYLYFSAGSQETMNRILSGANALDEYLKAKKYKNLKFEYKIHPGKTHNTQVPESLKYILKNI